jgi:hypothetical protein
MYTGLLMASLKISILQEQYYGVQANQKGVYAN